MSIQPADHAQTEPIPGAATPSRAQAEAEDLAHHTCDVLEFEFRHLHAGADEIHGPYRSAEERFRALWRRVHALTGEQRRMALCLSGGGIRSATFCLGVLQGLAQRGWLGRFHYLSTVSGGGYIGSWLTSWIQRREQNTQSVVEELSNPAAVGRAEPEPVRRLRAYSNYLSPVWGLSTDFVTLIAIFLRNLMLHWLVVIPLLLAVITLPRLHLAVLALEGTERYRWPALLALGLSVLLIVLGVAYVVADLPPQSNDAPPENRFMRLCLLPIVCAAVLLSWLAMWTARSAASSSYSCLWFAAAGAVVHLAGIGLGMLWRYLRNTPRDRLDDTSQDQAANRVAKQFTRLAFAVASGAAGGAAVYCVSSYLTELAYISFEHVQLYATLSVPAILASYWLATTAYAGLSRRTSTEGDREWWARSGAGWISVGVVWAMGFTLVIYGPQWVFGSPWFSSAIGPAQLGAGGAVLGVLTGLIGYWSKHANTLKQEAEGFIAATGLRMLDLAAMVFALILLLVLSYLVSWMLTWSWVQPGMAEQVAYLRDEAALQGSAQLAAGEAQAYALVLEHSVWWRVAVLAIVLGLIGVAASWFIGANTFSLHRMYGNRLVRAYLGATRGQRHPHPFTGFDPKDNLKLAGCNGVPRRLFHVINITLNLVRPSGGRLEWQERKAASFTATPLHCGSNTLGYVPTGYYAEGKRKKAGLTLGRAMAISGAAASPSMGYHSSAIVAFVMAFFNLRLGWWLPNPSPRFARRWRDNEPDAGLWSLLAEALAQTSDDTPYVHLSDGGHFENLGLYEMVRRRCHRIVVIDAAHDPGYAYEDLENAIRKIRIDLGISISFPAHGPPRPEGPSAQAAWHFAIGEIDYRDRDGGQAPLGSIVYIKPVLTGDEPLDLIRYASTTKTPDGAFPQQPTSDQFFDEAQFESYRMLGLHSVLQSFPETAQWPELTPRDLRRMRHKPVPVMAPAVAAAAGAAKVAGDPGVLSGVSGALQSMGQGAALAAALTVGGAVGVAGTLSLTPGTDIGLKKEAEELLRNGVDLKVTMPEQTVAQLLGQAAALTQAAQGLQRSIAGDGSANNDGLTASVTALTGRLGQMPASQASAPDPVRIQIQIAQLAGAASAAASAAATANAASIAIKVELTQVVNKLEAIRGALLEAKTSPTETVGAKLDAINRQLLQIDRTIKTIGPRSNVKGAQEGSGK